MLKKYKILKCALQINIKPILKMKIILIKYF